MLLSYNETDVNIPDKLGYTPVYVAALKGYTDILKMLIRSNARIDKALKVAVRNNNVDYSPLNYARRRGFSALVNKILGNQYLV